MNRLFPKLLTHGYFPRELPPTFSSFNYGELVSKNWSTFSSTFDEAKLKAHWMTHTSPRSGLLRRDLEIPNPIVFGVLSAEIAGQWKEIRSKIDRTNWSTTKPEFRKNAARALLAKYPQKALPLLRADRRGGAKFILEADVARFYPSIYTHSVPWVLHGKDKAKRNQRADSLLGNRLDRALRSCNDRQTIGIPIGPDSSLAIAELVLSEVDAGLSEIFPNVNALRFIDDYEFPVRSRAEAEDILEQLGARLAQVELALNTSKTLVRELPIPFEHPWTSELRSLPFRSKVTAQANDLIHAFDRAGDHARRDPNEPVFRYLLGRFSRLGLRKKNWRLYQGLLLQSISAEPGTITAALSSLISSRRDGYEPDRSVLEPELNYFLAEHSRFRRTNEVAWLLWGMMILKFKIATDAVRALQELNDPFVALLALHAESRGGLEAPLDKSNWMRFMTREQLYGDHWILAYEGLVRGWLEPLHGKNYIQDDPSFKFLARNKIRFYNEDAIENVSPTGISLSLGFAPLFYVV